MELIPGVKYKIPAFGKNPRLEFIRYYNNNPIFSSEEDISYYWCNTLGGSRGGNFNGKWYLILPMSEYILIDEKIYIWAIEKIKSILIDKASNSNIAITIKIAESMMVRDGFNIQKINSLSNLIKEKAIELVEEKQLKWSEILDSQLNQLPF